MTEDGETAKYIEQHSPFIESLFGTLVNEIFDSRPVDLEKFLRERLDARRPGPAASLDQVARAAEPSHAVTLSSLLAVQKKSQERKKRGEWTAVSWVESVGIASAVALALLHDLAGSETSEVDALQSLGDHSVPELAGVLRNGGLVESVAALLQPALHKLAHAEAVTTAQAQSKFAGQVEMSFGGLDAFYGGLEAQIGPPQPQVFEGMEAEHLRGADADAEWTTANYGLSTTAAAEWRFVVEAAATESKSRPSCCPTARAAASQPAPCTSSRRRPSRRTRRSAAQSSQSSPQTRLSGCVCTLARSSKSIMPSCVA